MAGHFSSTNVEAAAVSRDILCCFEHFNDNSDSTSDDVGGFDDAREGFLGAFPFAISDYETL